MLNAKKKRKKENLNLCTRAGLQRSGAGRQTDQCERTTASGAGLLASCHRDSIKLHTILSTLIQCEQGAPPSLSKFASLSRRPANVRHVPDVVLQRGHALLHGADLGVPLSHRLHQVAVGLLRLIQQPVGCQQLRSVHARKGDNKLSGGWHQAQL